ncbi:MAG: TSUP family transporter [Chlamydiales bacterium]|nr:sulfite exporter TauE/SafE family protein [Chlamydiales bacterium]NCF70794.1 TSUP family transporter [Chlamydiales bacterium]
MEILGYIAALLMGITLGTIGGGGSILTVPILVYLMGVTPAVATGYSLLIVGATAAFGAFRYYRKGLINLKASIFFALPSIAAVYFTRAYLVPSLPDPLLTQPIELGKDLGIMVFFALLMVSSSFMMLRNSKQLKPAKHAHHPAVLVMLEGAFVGIITGILGAGGGFLIIPALVLLMGMPMKEAVGASLLIIALKSLIGFIGDLQNGIELQIPLLPLMICCTLSGMWGATLLSSHFDGKRLQRSFAYFTLLVACIIFIKEFY